ncbi:MAG: AI-2E family transporter [Tissierellia bacterium]|nr:AI-2E family transporter [Tissierellia bacterium]
MNNLNMIKALIIVVLLFIILLIYYLINIGNKYIPENKKIKINKRKILPIVIGFLFIYLFYLLSRKYNIITDMIYTIIISMVLAYLINPIVNYLERYKMKRGIAVLFIYAIVLGIILILSFIIVPKTGKEIRSLLKLLPNYFHSISQTIDNIYIKYYESIDNMPNVFQGLDEIIISNVERLENTISTSISKFIEGIIFTFSKIISLVLIPILTFYFIRDGKYFKEKIYLMIPKSYRKDVKGLILEIDKALGQFIRGRLLLALYVGIATTILLLLFKVDFALIIGLITGVADIIPYLGPFLGFLPAVFFAFLYSPIKALWVGVLFLGIQWVENNVLAPKIIGKSTGIHPVTILLALVIGGGIFGIMGMILSIPFIATLKIIYNYFVIKINTFYNKE